MNLGESFESDFQKLYSKSTYVLTYTRPRVSNKRGVLKLCTKEKFLKSNKRGGSNSQK